MHSCDLCQHNKSSHHSPYSDLVPLEIPSCNWDSISMNFITNLPPSHAFDTLLVVVNCLSKQAHFIPTIKSLNTQVLLNCSFLPFLNFMVYLPASFLIMVLFSLLFSGMNSLHISVSNSNCPPLITHNLMAKLNPSTNVSNSTCK